jgi:hypothetical protein
VGYINRLDFVCFRDAFGIDSVLDPALLEAKKSNYGL